MLHLADVIAYLWLILVFVSFALPLVIFTINFPLMFTRRIFSTRKKINKNNRRYLRFSTCKNMSAQITVGGAICSALVSDISKMGISLRHLPDKFSYQINKLPVTIRHYGVDYKLIIKTKWVKLTKYGKEIGAEIEMASPEWNQYLVKKL